MRFLIIFIFFISTFFSNEIPNIKNIVINEIMSSTENVDIVILMSNGDTSHIINKMK